MIFGERGHALGDRSAPGEKDIAEADVGVVFFAVVQQRRNHIVFTFPHFQQQQGHKQRVDEVGLPAFAALAHVGAVGKKNRSPDALAAHAALVHGMQQAGGESSALAVMADVAEDVHGAILSTGLAGKTSVGKNAPLRCFNLGENCALSVGHSL